MKGAKPKRIHGNSKTGVNVRVKYFFNILSLYKTERIGVTAMGF